MAILAPFILLRVFQDITPEKAFKRTVLLEYTSSAGFLRQRLIALWISIARANCLLFSDHVELPGDLYKLQLYLAEERELFLELRGLADEFSKATPNYHVALHIPHQIYLCNTLSTALIFRWERSCILDILIRDATSGMNRPLLC